MKFGWSLTLAGVILLAACAKSGSNSDKAREIQVNDNGVTVSGGGPVIVGEGVAYQNVSLPQDFSLQMPVIASGTDGTIDLGRCYMDYAPGATNLDAQTRRLCGLQFTQVQLELRAMFLDLALPDIRAYCHNQLVGCDLSSQEFTVTISEPVMRRVQQLFAFYQYTGLEAYFQYNGYAIRNGAKIPFRISTYEEAPCGRFDYRAVIRTRVIGTYGGQAEVRDDAGDVVILWDRQRQNIAMDFRTSVSLFGFQINLRRTYDFADRSTGVRYTSSVNYWNAANPGFATLVDANAVIAEPCSNANASCTKFRHIAGEFIGDDSNLDGLNGGEAYYDSLRFSEGLIDANGGIIDSYLSADGTRNRERVIFRGTTITDYLFQAAGGQSLALISGDSASVVANTYQTKYATPTRLVLELHTDLTRPENLASRSLNWNSSADARDVTRVSGFAIAGSNDALSLRWGQGNYQTAAFAFSGAQNYADAGSVSENLHPLY